MVESPELLPGRADVRAPTTFVSEIASDFDGLAPERVTAEAVWLRPAAHKRRERKAEEGVRRGAGRTAL